MHETTRLLLDLDREARARSQALEEQGKLPAGFTTEHHPLSRLEQAELRRLKHAAAAAQDADTYVALAKGRPVDESHLDPKMVSYLKRHGPN